MLAGVATCLAYRLQAKGDAEPSPAELESVALAAKKTLAGSVEGNMSGPRKRTLLAKFAAAYFSGIEEKCHRGVPEGLLRVLSCSAFGLPSLPRSRVKANSKSTEPSQDTSPRVQEPISPNDAVPTLSV